MVVYHREDINGDPFFGNNSSRLDIVRVVRFTAKGVTTELDREPKSSWETKVFNTPYRKEKFLKLK
jgi:hypothetical protein